MVEVIFLRLVIGDWSSTAKKLQTIMTIVTNLKIYEENYESNESILENVYHWLFAFFFSWVKNGTLLHS